ncbi:MAG: hypothetical protein DBX55_00410 [Verrucomicrobia bacterium]|nr:MAG: hypothetical protein DBX55_00410 [Verrucomicrobiota bacterium]
MRGQPFARAMPFKRAISVQKSMRPAPYPECADKKCRRQNVRTIKATFAKVAENPTKTRKVSLKKTIRPLQCPKLRRRLPSMRRPAARNHSSRRHAKKISTAVRPRRPQRARKQTPSAFRADDAGARDAKQCKSAPLQKPARRLPGNRPRAKTKPQPKP